MGNASSSAAPLLKPVTESSSSCVTQGITAAHNFAVMNFSLLEVGKDVGEYINSRNFRVGGFDWNICLYPAGRTAQEKKYVSVFLNPEGGGQDKVKVRLTFTMLGKDGMVWMKRNTDHTFESPLDGFGCPTFMYKSCLFRRLLRKNNDCFTIRCVLAVIQDPRVEDVSAVVVSAPSVALVRDLESMLTNGDGADVTFVVGERLFPAHRCVLAARSAVFRAELFGPMKEKAARCVWVDDMEPSIFEALLHFVYTDSLPDDDDKDRNVPMMQHLLVAADRYGLDRLKAICEDRLCHAIDVKTVATTLTLAEQHHCEQLKDDCLWFIASRDHMLGSVMKTDGYKHLVASYPSLMNEILIRQDMAGVISSESSSKVVFC